MVSGNIKWQLKCPPHSKLATSSQISEKLTSSTFFSLMKHGHEKLGNHIIMVPLRILMRVLDLHVRTFKFQRIGKKKLFNNSNIIEVKALQVDTLLNILTKNW